MFCIWPDDGSVSRNMSSNILFDYQYILCLLTEGVAVLEKFLPIPMTRRSKAWVCGRLLAGISGSNSIGDIDICLL